jgi:hypothetical protein
MQTHERCAVLDFTGRFRVYRCVVMNPRAARAQLCRAEDRFDCHEAGVAENEVLSGGRRPPVWFAFDESRPTAFFAGIWTRWTSVRKVKEGETTNDIFAFLTTDANAEVGAIHPRRCRSSSRRRRNERLG